MLRISVAKYFRICLKLSNLLNHRRARRLDGFFGNDGTDDETIPDPYWLESDWTLFINFGLTTPLTSCFFCAGKHFPESSTFVVFSFATFDVSPPNQHDFSEVFA